MRKPLSKHEIAEIEKKLGPMRKGGSMVHVLMKEEHPLLYQEIRELGSESQISTLQFSRLAYYCLENGVPESEIAPMFKEVSKQAGAFYKLLVIQMADEWESTHVIERILSSQPYRG